MAAQVQGKPAADIKGAPPSAKKAGGLLALATVGSSVLAAAAPAL
jgi:hypothetical protein